MSNTENKALVSLNLDMLFESLPTGLIVFDQDENVLKINSQAKKILKMPADINLSQLKNLPDYLVELRIILITTQGDIIRSEMNLMLPDRKESSTIGFTLKDIHVEDNTWVKAFIFSDITHIIKDRLAFDRIKEELYQSKKLASLGTMISGVAHEMNNPLTGISMSTDLGRMNLERLKKRLDPEKDAETIASIDKALSELTKTLVAAKKASTLVTDLLTYAKPAKLQLTTEDMNVLVDDVSGALRTHPAFARLNMRLQPYTEPLPVLCDRVKIEQVFYNLIKNAGEAAGGEGEISIICGETRNAEGKRQVLVTVHDDGAGVDKTVIERIFDPFFSTKGNKGVGLGLSISYRTVEQHGGTLTVDSKEGEWTEFYVSLPLFEEEDIFI